MTTTRLADLWTEMEMMRDGTCRWLWEVRGPECLWRAGIAMSRTDAERESREYLALYSVQLQAAQAQAAAKKSDPIRMGTARPARPDEWGTTHLNLDQLEEAGQEEEQGQSGG